MPAAKLPRRGRRSQEPPLESNITKAIIKDINDRPGWRARKIHGGAYGAGWPDILAVNNGQAYFLEVKRPDPYGSPVTPLQRAELDAWASVGAVAVVVRSVAEVREWITERGVGNG